MDVISSLLSRRLMLVGLVGGAAAVGTVAVQQATDPQVEALKKRLTKRSRGRRHVPLATATADDWALQIGTKFKAATGHTLQLTDVRPFPLVGKRPKELRERAFVAGFDITSGGPLTGQRTYRVAHAEGGTFDIFLTDGRPAKPLRMYAVFN